MNITIRFGLRSVTLEYAGQTLGQIIEEVGPSLRLGDNMRYMIGETAVGLDFVPQPNTLVNAVTAANSKAAGITFTFGFRSMNVPAEGKTLSDLLAEIQPALRFGDNMRFMLNGTAVGLDIVPEDGMEVTVVTAANSKA